jgi:hypothetical protein
MELDKIKFKLELTNENGEVLGSIVVDLNTLHSMNVFHGFGLKDLIVFLLAQNNEKVNEELKNDILKFIKFTIKNTN